MPSTLPASNPSDQALATNDQRSPDLQRLDALVPDAIEELKASGHVPGYLRAMGRLKLMLTFPITDVQIRSVCLRLHAHGYTPEDAEWAVERLLDSPEFSDRIHRFRCPLTPSDFLEILRIKPTASDRYTEAQASKLADQLRLDISDFQTVAATDRNGNHLLAYVPAFATPDTTDDA